MVAQPVEWVLVVYYGPEAHRATYGRQVRSSRYTKDYIQLSRRKDFLEAVTNLFSVDADSTASVRLTYQWPAGTAPGEFVFHSGDRPHLKWETSLGAPKVWKMAPSPSDAAAETIPGDPSHLEFEDAEGEFVSLGDRRAGQPYLMAIKLRDEPRTLHLRAYLKNPGADYAWANLELVPKEIQALAAKTSQQSALAWSLFQSGGIAPSDGIDETLKRIDGLSNASEVVDALDAEAGRALTRYLQHPGHGLFFDPTRNHDGWLQSAPLSSEVAASLNGLLRILEEHFPATLQGDAAAESLETDPAEVRNFSEQIARNSYEVADVTATVKTRGSAQKAFAGAVKANYGHRCAITGVKTKEFLVASHIVPWSEDQAIRLDPSNGICLSLLVDRAFEIGCLKIEDDLTIQIDWNRLGDDPVLRSQLEPYDGIKLRAPAHGAPNQAYLQRRRELIAPTK